MQALPEEDPDLVQTPEEPGPTQQHQEVLRSLVSSRVNATETSQPLKSSFLLRSWRFVFYLVAFSAGLASLIYVGLMLGVGVRARVRARVLTPAGRLSCRLHGSGIPQSSGGVIPNR